MKTSEIITNCALTKVVSMLKNKDMLIYLPYLSFKWVRLKTF